MQGADNNGLATNGETGSGRAVLGGRSNGGLTARLAGQQVERAELFHTSGYAQVQSGEAMGAGGVQMDAVKRAAIEAQRKFVRGYQNARIMQSVYGVERARGRARKGGDEKMKTQFEVKVEGSGEQSGEYAQTRQAFKQEKIVRPSDKYKK